MKQVIIALVALAAHGCQPGQESAPKSDVNNQNGSLEIKVCSRGCYQYVLNTTDASAGRQLFPVNLDKALQQAALDYSSANQGNSLLVVFSGTLLSDSTELKTPGANDVPVSDGKIRNIRLTAIQKR